jgi:hypothetical protein
MNSYYEGGDDRFLDAKLIPLKLHQVPITLGDTVHIKQSR